MQEQDEGWQLASGTWLRDHRSGQWRLRATADGTLVEPRIPAPDLGRMVLANRDMGGEWFPPDFAYSHRTGALLEVTLPAQDATWVPPFGASALDGSATPACHGLRQTPVPLRLARTETRHAAGSADRTLPALKPGNYRFAVHNFDVLSPLLMAIKPGHGELLVLMPESRTWLALDSTDAELASGIANARGWRMELAGAPDGATLYLPTARGLAVVKPSVLRLAYTVAYWGDGPAIGGPVAWAGAVWLPVHGKDDCVHVVGKPPGEADAVVLPTDIPVPWSGFEAPVFDDRHLNWPCDEGQLVLRLDAGGATRVEWIPWPHAVEPVFALGCPYRSPSGAFWQLGRCDESMVYVRMAHAAREQVRIDETLLCTGSVFQGQARRVEGEPWLAGKPPIDAKPAQAVVPLLESEVDGVVVGLRVDAPDGALALVEAGPERHQAVLQLQARNEAEVSFGSFSATTPWLASLFVYDTHLWVHHPELAQPLGWELCFQEGGSP